MNAYEAKVEARRARLEGRAERLEAEGAARFARGRNAMALIPFGQPILIGHHSEKSDRSYRNRATNNMRKGAELITAAEQVAARAAAVGTGGVSSDNPEAVTLLLAQVEKLKAQQALMVAANKLFRKGEAGRPGLLALGLGEAAITSMLQPAWGNGRGPIGFEPYRLSNNSANIKRIEARIATLERNATRETVEIQSNEVPGVRLVENAEANRVQLFFPGKPAAEIRAELKARGFRWAPSEGAWQRHLGGNAIWAARCILETLAKGQPTNE